MMGEVTTSDMFLSMARLVLNGRDQPSVLELGLLLDRAAELTVSALGEEVDCSELTSQRQKIISEYTASVNCGDILTDEQHLPWLDQRRAEVESYYWKRYRDYLNNEKHWSPRVLNVMDHDTDQILDLCGNPSEDLSWDKRGLVVGHVQSGKTANYIGLIAKAADFGYKVIIVIAGTQNSLRDQTQIRIDEGFIGVDLTANTGRRTKVGVGRESDRRTPNGYTDRVNDFQRSRADLNAPIENSVEPVVFVIKKNVSVLRNLKSWLEKNGPKKYRTQIESPLLLIDDEADNASINTKYGKEEVTTINGLLRGILNLFRRKTYVGYTATPFANIFIDPESDDGMFKEDLFPRSFIVSLDAPNNYFGAEKIFLDDAGTHLREVSDFEDILPLKHDKTTEIDELPSSLKDAIRTFLLAVAIKKVKHMGNAHSTMMINVSRFVDVQEEVWNCVTDYHRALANSCQAYGRMDPELAIEDHNIRDLHETWEKEYGDEGVQWCEVLPALAGSAPEISVVRINGRSRDTLGYERYETGLKVIAVGGQALSRGLTLEGLTVSYYLRRTNMYDTLMQMGRWFGYRTGYESLCRVFMPSEVAGHFEHVAESVTELREELTRMQKIGQTPRNFGLCVRSHPDMLMVTAANKMGGAEERTVQISLSGRLVETSSVYFDPDSLKQNRRDVDCLLGDLLDEKLRGPEIVDGHLLFRDVGFGSVERFLLGFKNAPLSVLSNPESVIAFVNTHAQELARWDVLFVSPQRGVSPLSDTLRGYEINCQKRTISRIDEGSKVLTFAKNRLGSRGIEKYGLSAESIRDVEAAGQQSGQRKRSIPDVEYRRRRPRPMLLVQLIDCRDKETNESLTSNCPVTGWSISFTTVANPGATVSYVVNQVYAREIDGQFDDNTEDDYGE